MADGHFSTLVSKDRDANAVSNPIYVQLTDGTEVALIDASGNLNVVGTVVVTATDLDIRNLSETTDHVLIFGNTAKDGSGTDYVPLLDADGKVIISNPGGTEYTEDVATPATILGTATMFERDDALSTITPAEGDWASMRCNAKGALWVELDPTNAVTVTGTVAATQSGVWDIGTLTGITNDVNIADGGNSITVDGAVTVSATDLDIRNLNLTDDAVKVSGNTSANSETNPIYVYNTAAVTSGNEIADYDTAASVASDASDNHDYTVSGTTFMLKSVIFASSGGGKAEIQVGPLASLVSKAVCFVPKHGGDTQLFFDPPIEVPSASTGTVRVIRTNREGSAQDVYSTIIGSDIA